MEIAEIVFSRGGKLKQQGLESRFNTDVFVSTLRFFRLLQFFLLFLHAFYITKPFSQRRTIEIC